MVPSGGYDVRETVGGGWSGSSAHGRGAAEKADEPPPSQAAPVAGRPAPVAADMAAAVSGFDAFGLDLLAAPTLAQEPNLVVSPVSVSIALQLVGAGAKGETAAQIRKVLRLPDDSLPPLPAFDQTDLKVSNTAWAQRGLELESDYRDALRDRFADLLREADFVGDPNGAAGGSTRPSPSRRPARSPTCSPRNRSLSTPGWCSPTRST